MAVRWQMLNHLVTIVFGSKVWYNYFSQTIDTFVQSSLTVQKPDLLFMLTKKRLVILLVFFYYLLIKIITANITINKLINRTCFPNRDAILKDFVKCIKHRLINLSRNLRFRYFYIIKLILNI